MGPCRDKSWAFKGKTKMFKEAGTNDNNLQVHIYHHFINNTFRVVGRKLQDHEVRWKLIFFLYILYIIQEGSSALCKAEDLCGGCCHCYCSRAITKSHPTSQASHKTFNFALLIVSFLGCYKLCNIERVEIQPSHPNLPPVER